MYKQTEEESWKNYLHSLNTTYNIPLLKEFQSVRQLSELSNPNLLKQSLPTRKDFEKKIRRKNAREAKNNVIRDKFNESRVRFRASKSPQDSNAMLIL